MRTLLLIKPPEHCLPCHRPDSLTLDDGSLRAAALLMRVSEPWPRTRERLLTVPSVSESHNAGSIVRDGPLLLRSSGPHSASIYALLRGIVDAGFDGAPVPLDVEDDERGRLMFIAGETPGPPYPPWCQTHAALALVANLLRRIRAGADGFDPRGLSWNDTLADPACSSVICHNDVGLSNVVFRDGVAVALIDFEFAAPSRPVYALNRIETAARRGLETGDPDIIATVERTGGVDKYDQRRR